MRILLTGATGFIGRHLAIALEQNGHAVVCAARGRNRAATPGCSSIVDADFTRDTAAEAWLPRLRGVDAVINAVGILREQGSQTFDSLHVRGPRALFDACAMAGVSRVIQISALGADENARSAYHLSKRQADRHLASLPLAWTIVQPSLVYGPGGQSARLFTMLASLPWIVLPGDGLQRVQPLYIDDLTTGVVALLAGERGVRSTIAFVGPEPMGLRDFLAQLRAGLRLAPTRFVPMPLALVRAGARMMQLLPHSLLDVETLEMLQRGNTGDASAFIQLAGRPLRAPSAFVAAADAEPVRTAAQVSWLLPLLRWSLALVWIVTGIVSLGLYPVSESYELLARVGVPGVLQPLFLYGAAALDLAFGLGTLFLRRRQALWLAQASLIVFYTAIITVRMPEFWLHPYGPLLKNLPMLAAIAMLYVMEKR